MNFARILWTPFLRNTLLVLYLAIIYSWQLSSSDKLTTFQVISREKTIHMIHRFYRFRFLLYRYFFIFFGNACLHCRLHKAYGVLWAANRFVDLETRHLNTDALDQFWKFEFHFEHFPRNTRFLSFDALTNYLYLFKTFPWPGEVRHLTSKLLKCDLVETLNNFRNPL